MNKLEKMLNDSKSELDELVVPNELENRLNNALHNKSACKKHKGGWQVKLAVLLVVMLITCNVDAIAYYGRELLGFDSVMNGTLRELNKMGMGQAVEQSYTFSNGAVVTLNGVMMDDNQLLAYYTVENPNGKVDELQFNNGHMEGATAIYYARSGQGEYSDDEAAIKWVCAFEPPSAFEKSLIWKFTISIDGKAEEGEINFVLDRAKAMGYTLKSKLNKTIKVDGTNIRVKEIIASPTITRVKGSLRNTLELALGIISDERIYSSSVDARLIANGKEVQRQGSGASTSMKGMEFKITYDALPKDLKTLQLNIVGFDAEHETDEVIKLYKSLTHQATVIENQDIIIESVVESKGETLVTITTEEDAVLSKVYLLADDNPIELTETIDSKRDKKKDGATAHTRTLRFKATSENLQLEVKRIRYRTDCDEYINIPIK